MSDNAIQWYKDAIIYQVYPRGFYDSNADGTGDLRGVTEKLDYLRELGVDCLRRHLLGWPVDERIDFERR